MRPDLLTHVVAASEAIPEEIPPNFLDRYKKKEVEGVGEPMTACFLTGVHSDPTNWYLNFYQTHLAYLNFVSLKGGCLKSMMECERFGIHQSEHFIHAMATNLRCLRILSHPCQRIFS